MLWGLNNLMKKFLIGAWIFFYRILTWVYRLVFLPVVSIPFVLFHFLKMIFTGNIISALKEWRRLNKIKSISQLNLEYSKFIYRYEGLYEHDEKALTKRPIFSMWPTWVAPILIFIGRGKQGNCDDAAYFGRKLYKYLFRNVPELKNELEVMVRVYVPWNIPDCFLKIHYITEVKNKVFDNTTILSNGKISYEEKDSLAERYLGHKKFFWMRLDRKE